MDTKLPDTLPLVIIHWRDIVFGVNEAWMTVQKALEWAEKGPGECVSVGLLLKKTRKYVLLTSSIDAKTSDEQDVGGVIFIPRGCIDDIKVIRQVKR